MKRFYSGYLLLALSGVIMLPACRSSKASKGGILEGTNMTGTITKTVMTVIGAILLSKILNGVLKQTQANAAFANLSDNQVFKNVNEDTKLNSFASNDVLKTALQLLVADKFKIPVNKVANNYGNMSTLGDLATFIGQNAPADVLMQFK